MANSIKYAGLFSLGAAFAFACSTGGGGNAGSGGGPVGGGSGAGGATGGDGGKAGVGATAGTSSIGGAGTGGTTTGGKGGQAGTSTAGTTSTGGTVQDSGLPDVEFTYDGDVPEPDACASVTAEAISPPVDIIWIIDQSCSMNAEITQVRSNINNNFATIIGGSGLDYRVIMFAGSTGQYPVCVNAPLGGSSCGADNPPRFFHVNQHVERRDSLSLFQSRYTAQVLPHLRQAALKVFVEVTDDRSQVSSSAFQTWLTSATASGLLGTQAQPNYIFHSIVGVNTPLPPTAAVTNSKCSSAVNTGPQYQELSIASGGLRHPVCDSNYSTVFTNIANNVIQAVACELIIPTVMGGVIDYNAVKVKYTPMGTGTPVFYNQVANQAACAGGDGYYYDNPAAPTRVLLCPNSCSTVQADQAGKLELELGCLQS